MRGKGVAWLLWCLSWFGVGGLHRFYLGKPISGVIYLCTFNVFYLGLLVDAFNLNEMVELANLKHKQLSGTSSDTMMALPEANEKFMRDLVRAAQQHGGMLSVTEGVMATGRSFADVEAQLEKMRLSGYVGIDNHPKSGVVVYRFTELEGQSSDIT